MSYRIERVCLQITGLLVASALAPAATIANCTSDFSQCSIPANVSLQLPFLAAAGDVVLTEFNSTGISDVFRIFNNFVDTGLGTGLGNLAFLYTAENNNLPSPSRYSANEVFMTENPSGVTPYLGNGTTYLLGVPEPRTLALLGLAGIVLRVASRRAKSIQGGL